MRNPFLPAAAAFTAALTLAACGGGDVEAPAEAAAAPDATAMAAKRASLAPTRKAGANMTGKTTAPPTGAPVAATTGSPTDSQRAAAASATAGSTVNACNAVRPFYWEVGTASGSKASGSVRSSTSSVSYAASTTMAVASASKWLYGAYVVQKRGGQPTVEDRKSLSMRAGYVSFQTCLATQTVDSCLAMGNNGDYTAATDGRYFYNGGHMQKHASQMGLGAMDARALAAEFRSQLGSDVPLTMAQPRPEGAFVMTPAAYATVLRKMLSGSLRIGGLLGTDAACASPRTCGLQQAIASPVQDDEVFHYSLGHWIEDDPGLGDGAFSSAGAYGFYPWINAAKSHYGIVARVDKTSESAGWASMLCGRLIRKAFASGVAL